MTGELIKNSFLAALVTILVNKQTEMVSGLEENELVKNVIYVAMIAGIAIIITIAPKLIDFFYSRVSLFRRIHTSLLPNTPFIEGEWVDVCYTREGNYSVYHSYAHVIIEYRDNSYFLEGTTWNTSGQKESSWTRILDPEFNDNSLKFAYAVEYFHRSYENKEESVAQFKFSRDHSNSNFPKSYSGSYYSDGKLYIIEATRLKSGKLSRFSGGDRKKDLAKSNYDEKLKRDRENKINYKQQNVTDFSNHNTWFSSFLRGTNNKENEIKMLSVDGFKESMSQYLSRKNNIQILDLGSGSGEMSLQFIDLYLKLNNKFSYTGVEIDSNAISVSKRKIHDTFGGIDECYMNMSIEQAISKINQNDNSFDIVIVFNSGYYVSDIHKFFESLYKSLSKDSVMIFLHTKESDFLRECQELCGSSITNNIPTLVENYCNTKGLLLNNEVGIERLLFPDLADYEWERIIETSFEESPSDSINEAKWRLCFLLQKSYSEISDLSNWGTYVRKVREFLEENENKFPLDIYLQWVYVKK